MPVLFDDCAFSHKEPYLGKQDYPIKGVHNSGWTPSPGFRIADDKNERPFLKEYVSEIIESYKKIEEFFYGICIMSQVIVTEMKSVFLY